MIIMRGHRDGNKLEKKNERYIEKIGKRLEIFGIRCRNTVASFHVRLKSFFVLKKWVFQSIYNDENPIYSATRSLCSILSSFCSYLSWK
jgi:hypothetical protein